MLTVVVVMSVWYLVVEELRVFTSSEFRYRQYVYVAGGQNLLIFVLCNPLRSRPVTS